MPVTVDFVRLAKALTDFDYAFLITVGDGDKPHTVMVEPVFADDVFDVGPVGDRTAESIANRRDVTVLWPPRRPGGYALMVDGRADVTAGDTVRVVPTKALLHRKAIPGSPAADSGCLHDCVVFTAVIL
jgi:hypothetical protein